MTNVLEARIEKLEKEIEKLERKIAKLENKIDNPPREFLFM